MDQEKDAAAMAARPMTVAEIQKHPEFPHVTWKLKPVREGKILVAKGRGGPFRLAFKLHGRGSRLILLIMGLGGIDASWQRQVKDFGHTHGDKYSVLVFDNRGIGQSDKPRMRYSTSEMARDTTELLHYVGWTAPRSLHVVGVSMGGMIAQELATLIPNRIATLTLLSTAAQIVNTVGFLENLKARAQLFIPKSLDISIANAKRNLYTDDFLARPDELEYTVEPFPTNGDRYAASELRKRLNPGGYTKRGFIQQAIAAGWHKKTREQLRRLGDEVGRARITVIHGTEDRMIAVSHGHTLAQRLSTEGEAVKSVFWEGQGHVIPAEKRKEFNRLLEDNIEEFHNDLDQA